MAGQTRLDPSTERRLELSQIGEEILLIRMGKALHAHCTNSESREHRLAAYEKAGITPAEMRWGDREVHRLQLVWWGCMIAKDYERCLSVAKNCEMEVTQ